VVSDADPNADSGAHAASASAIAAATSNDRELWRTWYKTAALLREGLDVSPIITHRLPLSRFEEAFDLLGQGIAGKVVLLPQEG